MDPVYYGTIKALHLIFMVTWFAGLFYGFRLFVYHAEADKKPEPQRTILMRQFTLMEGRLWHIIAWPSCVLTVLFGFWLSALNPAVWSEGALHLKLFFVILLVIYQVYGERVLRKLRAGIVPHSSTRFRLLNEVPTVILIAVIFLIVLRDELSWIWGLVGILGIAGLLTFAVKKYRAARARKGEQVD